MKRIAYIFAICAAALVSCSKPELGTGDAMAPGLNITLKMAGPATKAGSTMPGVAELNENKIESIAYFVFDTNDGSLINKGTKTVGVDVTSGGINVNLSLSEEMFSDIIFATGHSKLYVVANATEAFSGLSTVSEIENKLITLAKTEGKQDSFVMYGTSTSIAETASVGDKRRAVVSVDLKRVIAKVSLKVTVDKIFEKAVNADGTDLNEGETSDVKVRWTSNPAEVKVKFSGLASQAKIAPAGVFKPELFDIDYKTYTSNVVETDPSYDCLSDLPYYTYPRAWTIDDETKPYFLVSIPWTSEIIGTPEGDWFQPTTATTYYKVILGGTFASNNWYAISVALKGLGSLTPGSAVEISPLDLTVADWKDSVEGETHFHTEAQFQDARVLDIPQDLITLYNQESASIPFISSHPCVVQSATVSVVDYTQASMPSSSSDAKSNVSISGNTIYFSHDLNNNLNISPFDYRALTYTITICHSDDSNFSETVTVIQIPSLSIAATPNSDGYNSRTTFVNGTQGTNKSSSTSADFGTVQGNISDANNSNPNMYVVSVATLNDYKLTDGNTLAFVGDPRTSSVDNVGLTGTSSKSAPSVQGTTRRISDYYPSDASKNNVIAPVIRVASSHGATSSLGFTDAKKRCATYQEDGYPAGRWRVPTRAEVEFISTLSNKKLITRLFGSSSGTTKYWCASGYITVGGTSVTWSSGTSTNVFVRCVYDEWYWSNSDYPTVSKNTFTWGDMPR
ncbi:MAG: fimbrial protein [Bacteroidales bacterium]|nr:fimbrial protein [Bacteroidales bacterium]